MKNKSIRTTGITIVTLFIIVAIFAPLFAPYNPYAIVGPSFSPPSAQFLLGTNDVGNDILSELIYGARYSISIGLLTALISSFLAVIFGILAGWFGGWIDESLMKITAFFITIPYLPFVIVLAAFLPGGIITMAIILGVVSWPETARILRSQTIKIKSHTYISSIKAMGAKDSYIIKKHVFRELLPIITYQAILKIRYAILAESALSFLGLGATTAKSWGSMLYYAQARNAFLTSSWLWWVIPPGLCIALFCFAFMLIAYSIEKNSDESLEVHIHE